MIKQYLQISALLLSSMAVGQSVSDGLMIGMQDAYGSARFRAVSGAFGAVGGDLSALTVNPAGSTVFSTHYFGLSLANTNNSNNSSFNNSTGNDRDFDLALNQGGMVFVYENIDPNASVNKFAWGLNYDATRNYDDRTFVSGINDVSISEYFLSYAQGEILDNFQLRTDETIDGLYRFLGENGGFGLQQGFLGYQSFIIEPLDDNDVNNTEYTSNIAAGNFNQQLLQILDGRQSKFSINVGAEIRSKLNVGLNLNFHGIDQNRYSQFAEQNNNSGAVDAVRFNNDLQTNGNGFSLQLGAIYKLTPALRIGASYESPTWYTLEETLLQEVSARRIDGSGFITEVIAPDVLNVFAPYQLRTPGSFTGSAAYIFEKKGFISVDYMIRDYTQLRFPNNDIGFSLNNQEIAQSLTTAASLRVGGEYLLERLSLRAGYRFEQSPYENGQTIGDLTGFSAGVGYIWGASRLDLSYNRSERSYEQQFFNQGLTSTATIDNVQNNITLTYGFQF